MPSSSTTLGDLNLRGMRIWLSGAVPESESPNPDTKLAFEVWDGSMLEYGILGFVQEFTSLVFKYGGEIIHGCHPTLTPILLEQARSFASSNDKKILSLTVSDHFQNDQRLGEWKQWERDANVEIVSGTGMDESDRDSSLAILRAHMAEQCNAFVAVGGLWWHDVPGRAGIPREFELAKQAGVPCFILGGFGGVSATYIQREPDWGAELRNGLSDEQNFAIATDTNFNLVAGRLAAQLHLLNQDDSGSEPKLMAR